MTTDSYDGGHGGCLHERRLLVRNNWFHEIGRCQRFCVWFSNAPPWQEQMTEKKLLVERYVLQTNTNTDGRVESRDNEHRTMKNKCCTISRKARNRRTRKQVCGHEPTHQVLALSSTKNTLDVQSLNKTQRTKHLRQFLEETGLSNLMCVPTTCFPIRAADKTDNHKRGANTNAVA